MTARIRRHSLALHRGLLSRSGARRGAIIIAGAVIAGVATAVPAAADEDSSPDSNVSAQGSVRSSTKASPGSVGGRSGSASVGDNDNGPSFGAASPQTRVPTGNRACNCETPHPESHVSAQQTSVRHDRGGSKQIISTHDEARSSTTRIVARNNADGSRTVSDQHGTSTFWPTPAELLGVAETPAAHPAPAPPPVAAPPPGEAPVFGADTWTIVVGGFNDPNGTVFKGGVDEVIQYSAQLSGVSAREGVDKLNAAVRAHQAANPGQHIKVIGYSEGAAVVHTWASENSGTVDNVNTVLISDPKRQGGPGTAGLSGHPVAGVVGAPLSGSDSNFGDIPTVSVCTNDTICDTSAPSGIPGYLSGAHGNYSFNVDDYSDNGDGQIFNGQHIPW
jgi:cutinase